MRELTQEELKQVELEILKDVARFCDKNDIRYYLGGGTLLGAVRHQGFIPWDDDIDISMPRPDYERFFATYNGSNNQYVARAIETDSNYWRTFGKVFDSRTYLEESYIRVPQKLNAVFIDVFPIDGLPSSSIKRMLRGRTQEFLTVLYRGSACSYTVSHKYNDSEKSNANFRNLMRSLLKFIAITFLRPLPTKSLIRLINYNAQRNDYESSDIIGAITECTHGARREFIQKSIFEPRRKFLFEGEQFWGPKGYENYLRNLYGDYMSLPPKEKRITHHDFKAYFI